MSIEIFLIALWAGISGVDYYNGCFMIGRPIITGPIVGMILGDYNTGLIVGATLELAWLGLAPLAGAQPPNIIIGSAVGVVFAIKSGLEATAVVAIALPFAILMQQLIVLQFTVMSTIMHKADVYCDNAQPKMISRINYGGLILLFILYFICALIPIYFGEEMANAIISYVPKNIIDGLSVAGGLMPALGFSMLLKMMFKINFAPYFIVGFVAATFLKMPIIAIALIALSIATIDYYNRAQKNNSQASTAEPSEGI